MHCIYYVRTMYNTNVGAIVVSLYRHVMLWNPEIRTHRLHIDASLIGLQYFTYIVPIIMKIIDKDWYRIKPE